MLNTNGDHEGILLTDMQTRETCFCFVIAPVPRHTRCAQLTGRLTGQRYGTTRTGAALESRPGL